MKNLSHTITCLAWLILVLTGCEKHSDKEQSKNTATANIEESSKTNLDAVTKPLLSEPEFDDPADGYFQAYLLIRISEKTEDQQESIRTLKEALRYFEAVENKFPDWKRSMVDARIQDTQQKLESLSMNSAKLRANKPHHPTASSRSVSMISRNYNLNPALAFRCRY